jgi:hypothetical protein
MTRTFSAVMMGITLLLDSTSTAPKALTVTGETGLSGS